MKPEQRMTSRERVGAVTATATEEIRILKALIRPRAVLLAPGAGPRIGVFDSDNLRSPRLTADRSALDRLLEKDWVALSACAADGVRRYRITRAGQMAATRRDDGPSKRPTAASGGGSYRRAHMIAAEKLFQTAPDAEPESLQVNLGESPVGWLARRRGPDGRPFLGALEVEAAERLRMDFERARLGQHVTQDWDRMLAPGRASGGRTERMLSDSAIAARNRLAKAARTLGPGLWDAAYRACCHLEGLEQVESELDLPARSGKAILRIALQQLVNVYGLARGDDRPIQIPPLD